MSKISPTGDSLRACNAGQHPATASGTTAGATACLNRETSMTAFRFVHFAGAAALALTALFAAPQPAAAQSKKIRIGFVTRSEEHTSELQVTNAHLVCRLLLEKQKK